MKSTNPPNTPILSVVPTTPTVVEEAKIETKDIQSLDIDKLRETMLKNIYVVEAALFEQAGFEYKRVNSIRALVSSLEKELFSDNALSMMTPDQKIKLYNNLTQNMGRSLDFLSMLHDNVTSGIDTLNKIEKLKTETDVVKRVEENAGATTAVEDIKRMILSQIKERSKK